MMHRVRSALSRFLGAGAVTALALFVAVAPAAAQQTTGKVEGTVTDQAGVALANAQIFVAGTSFGAVTNDKGYYFINNVPVGSYTLRAQFIGYAPTEVRDVRILGGQTITQDIKLAPSAIQVSGLTVTAASNPIVPRDQVASKSIVSGELVNNLPVDDVRNVIALQPGVVESGQAAGVSIRGGRPGEANVYIDGASVRATNMGGQRITLGTNSVEEASVTTGALGVEFSDAQSGVISFTTRSGGQQLQGNLSYETDQPFGDAISYGYNRFEGSLGGPVLGNLRFFVSGILQGQLTAFRQKGAENAPFFSVGGVDQVVVDSTGTTGLQSVALPEFVQYSGQCGQLGSSASPLAQAIANNYGVSCQGVRRPMDWANTLQAQGKLSYSYGNGSSVSLTGLAQGQQNRTYPGTNIDAPGLYTGTHSWQRLAVLNLTHSAFKSAERELAINLNLSWARDRSIFGPLDPQSELATRDPTMGVTFKTLQFSGFPNFPFPIGDDIVRNIRSGAGLRVPMLNNGSIDASQPFRLNPYGMQSGSWSTSGSNTGGSLLSETRMSGRLVVDWQANRFHRFTLGGDAKKTDLSYWQDAFLNAQIFMNAYVVHPVQYGLFAADRLDLGDVVIEVGARYDYYDSRTLFAKTPGRIFTNPDWNLDAATDDAIYQQMLADTNIFTPSKGHHTISPRLRVSFPITEQTDFRLSYSHQVQTPEFTTLLTGINNDLSFTNTNDVFGRDLDFGKTILFEFGVRHAFSQNLVLDVSAYNKDKVSDYAARILPFVDPRTTSDTLNVDVLTNRDFGNTRGIDTKFDWRLASYLSVSAAYTFQNSKNTGSDPFSYLNTFARQVSGLTGDRTPPPEASQRTNDDRTHNFVGAVALSFPDDFKHGTTVGAILRNVGVFSTIRVQSGLPYTRLVNDGVGQTADHLIFGLSGRAAEPLNASVMPWTKFVDLRLNKGLRLGRLDVTAFADVRNLFNWTNIVNLFAESGDVVNSAHRTKTLTSEFSGLLDEANQAAALEADGTTIDLRGSCQGWSKPVNCESLRRVEARFGDGNGQYSLAEQQRALNTYYDAFFGAYRFNSQGRSIRIGFETSF
jgi:hypothetical protein